MEKKTFTSFAIITFLMSSTAVVAMNTDEEKPGATVGLAVQLKETEKQATPKKTWSIFSFSSWFSSTSSAEEASHTSIPSAAPATELPKESPTPTADDLITRSMTLDPGQLQQILKAVDSDNPETLKNAEEILNSTPATVPSSTPVEPLSKADEWALRRLWNRFWGTGSTATLSVQTEETPTSTPSVVPSIPVFTETQASSSNEDLMRPAKTSRIEDTVSFNSIFKTEMGSSIPQGWTLYDGRKGRRGEERTAQNPLQVEVIGSGKIKITGDMYNFYYHLPALKNFAGQEMHFSAKVKSTVPGTRLAYIGKRENQINSAPYSNREGEETMSFTFVVDPDQASLNNLYFLGGRAKEEIPPSMEISDVKLELVGEKD